MEFAAMKIQYPAMREELRSYLKALSDEEHQKKYWLEGVSDENIEHDDFDLSIHFLYDDTSLADNPESMIGVILVSEHEAAVVSDLIGCIDRIFETHGLRLTDSEYLSLPEWKLVVAAAGKAYNEIPALYGEGHEARPL